MIHKFETDDVRVERIGSGGQFDTILELCSREQTGGVVATPTQQAKLDGVKLLYLCIKNSISYGEHVPRIPAIKAVREITGMELRAAKDLVESW